MKVVLILVLALVALCAAKNNKITHSKVTSTAQARLDTQLKMFDQLNSEEGADVEKSDKICLFFHGVGYHEEEKGNPTSDSIYDLDHDWVKANWGSTVGKGIANLCTPKYFFYNSRDNGFNDENIAKAYCSAIKNEQPAVVFSHSMGNLILSHGIKEGYEGCDLLTNDNTKWFSIEAPWKGSEAINSVEILCDAKHEGCFDGSDDDKWVKFIEDRPIPNKDYMVNIRQNKTFVMPIPNYVFLKNIAELYCKEDSTDEKVLPEGYLSLFPIVPTRAKVGENAKEYVDGALCGNKPTSDCSKWFDGDLIVRTGLEAIGQRIVPWYDSGAGDNINDGLVGIDSCKLEGVNYGDKPTDAFSVLEISHLDGLAKNCGSGDDAVQWIVARVSDVLG